MGSKLEYWFLLTKIAMSRFWTWWLKMASALSSQRLTTWGGSCGMNGGGNVHLIPDLVACWWWDRSSTYLLKPVNFPKSDFHRSNLPDKRLAIGWILGNWEGLLVNGKSKIWTRLEIGLWKIDGFEKVGRRTIPPPKCHKIHHESSSAGTTTPMPSSIITSKTTAAIFVKTNTLTYYPCSLTPVN